MSFLGNSMDKQKYTESRDALSEIIDPLRRLPIVSTLERLGWYVKPDKDYRSIKGRQTQRLHVSHEGGVVVELLVTGEKWYDKQSEQGGGGAIDLVMHLHRESFKQAVQRLLMLPSGTATSEHDETLTNQSGSRFKPFQIAKKRLTQTRHQQGDFFIADIMGWIPKDDVASMEHPLFALKAGDKRLRVYERNGVTVKVAPGYHGHATIHDKDMWIYCISQLVNAKNEGKAIDRTIRFVMKDFLVATNRDTSGRAYQRAEEMLERLKGTSVTTNIKTDEISEHRGFGLIDAWKVVERDGDKRMVSVEVTLSDWLFRSIDSMQVLTLSYDYFRLRKALDRRI